MVIKGLEKEMDIEFHLMSDTIIFLETALSSSMQVFQSYISLKKSGW